MKRTHLLSLIVLTLTVACNSEAKKTNSCPARLSGPWNFGAAPYGCVIQKPAVQEAEYKYTNLIFDDAKNNSQERTRYVSEMYNYISQISQAYLDRREPDMSSEDLDKWNHLMYSIASQESYWSNYRRGKDQRFRFFKGDGDNGFGLMQIDRRSHGKFISSGKIYDLQSQMVYAMDIIYQAYKKAKSSPCKDSSNSQDLHRSIYSMYNGGFGSRCRWSNASSRWSKNDAAFLQKYQQHPWEKYLSTNLIAQRGQ